MYLLLYPELLGIEFLASSIVRKCSAIELHIQSPRESLRFFSIYIYSVCMHDCVFGNKNTMAHEQSSEDNLLDGVHSLLLSYRTTAFLIPCGNRASNLGNQVRQQELLLTETSCWSLYTTYSIHKNYTLAIIVINWLRK